MKILFAGFEGEYNSSKILLDELKCENKLYLKNDKTLSCRQIERELKNDYDVVFLFGQKPKIKNKLCLELYAKNGDEILKTEFDVKKLAEKLKIAGIVSYFSDKSGNSYCNNIYFYVLKQINDKKLNTKAVFVHLPQLKNIENMDFFADFFGLSQFL